MLAKLLSLAEDNSLPSSEEKREGNVLIAMLNEHNERKAEAEKDISRRYCEHLGTVKTDVTGHVDCPN